MKSQLNWAILGTGSIANEMALSLTQSGKVPFSVANRSHDKAVDFAKKYNIRKVYDNIGDIFSDKDVDVIYLATTHNSHYEFIKKALENGKHVLCEKAITLNSNELESAANLAKEQNCILAEAMTIWHMPIYNELMKIIDSKELGHVKIIQVNFGSFKEYSMENRFFNPTLAGGALLDIGTYAISLARLFMTECPKDIKSHMIKAPTGVDESSSIILKNDNNEMASITLSLHSKQPKRCVISCENGYIEINDYPRAGNAKIVYAKSLSEKEISVGETKNALYYEALDMENAILNNNSSDMKLNLSCDVMHIMTALRKEWNIKYNGENY